MRIVPTSAIPLFFLIFTFLPLPLQAQFIEHDHFEEVVLKMELMLPWGPNEIVTFQGSVEMQVFFEGNEGDAEDDDMNGRDEVSTLFADLEAFGVSPSAGPLRLTLNTGIPSSGLYEEVVNNTPGLLDVPPFTVDGQLEVIQPTFFQIEILNLFGTRLRNPQPQPLTGILNYKPAAPGDLWTSDQFTELHDSAGEPTGWSCRVLYLLLWPTWENDLFPTTTAELELWDPSGDTMTVDLEGNLGIQAIFEGAVEGVATDDDDNGRDEIDTEITTLNLTGDSPYGAVILTETQEPRSSGVIEETLNLNHTWLDIPPFTTPGPGPADSFFDVHFDLTVGTQFMRSSDACRITGVVTHKPAGPGDELHGDTMVPLVDGAGNPTGWQMRLNFLRPVPGSSNVGDDALPRLAAPLLTASPNPFNPRVRIGFRGNSSEQAVLKVLDLRGWLISTLFEGAIGMEETVVFWNGRDDSGQAVASGSYYLLLETTSGTTGKTILLVR